MVLSKKTQHIIAAMPDPLWVAAAVVGILAFGLQPIGQCIGITFISGKEN
jgi:hypothetical protein